ncbi:winged helix-turn-helix domain-containing protein [Rhodococcus rhodochrous]|nr:winged helix-turn-helix domain-containing protein [Rhodococcus rhodochrous]
MANPGRGLRRAATLPAVARCCIDRLNSPVWTLGRVAIVIERVTGVTYGPTQTWTILRTRLGWSRQRPARRAVERDEDAIVAWRENEWPRIKK